jgi:hypothetical protein
VRFKSKICLSILRYVAQPGVDSVLCCIAGSWDPALCGIARSRDSPLCGIVRSLFSLSYLVEDLREFESICKTVLAHVLGDLGVQFNGKN